MDALYGSLPIDARKKELRLVTILPSRKDAMLRCRLRRVSLLHTNSEYHEMQAANGARYINTFESLKAWTGDAQIRTFPQRQANHRFHWGDFAALSYTWGDALNTTTIEVNGTITQITKTLAAALEHFRQTARFADNFSLWIDALCINQRDHDERSQQVAVMREYYSIAWSVICFSGPSDEHTAKATALIRELSDVYSHSESCERLLDRYTSQSPPEGHAHAPGSWLALAKLVRRSYWTRLWIIQEVTLGADRVVLYCGAEEIRWQDFCQAIEMIHRWLWLVKYKAIEQDCIRCPEEAQLYEIDRALMHIQKDLLTLSERQRAGSQPLDLRRLMEISAHSMCSDARDRVYGMLGVMDQEVANLIEPAYNATASDAFIRAAKAHMHVHQNIDFLRDAKLWGTQGAPTWVPDWTWTGRQRDSRPDDATLVRTERRPYFANRGMPAHLLLYRGRRLLCRATLFDAIDGLGTNGIADGHQTILLQSQANDTVYGDPESTTRNLHTALYADRRRVVSDNLALFQMPMTLEQARDRFAALGWTSFTQELRFSNRWVDWVRCNKDLRIGGIELRRYFSGDIPTDADEEEYLTTYRAWVRTAVAGNRRLFTSTGGRFGWVSCSSGVEAGQDREAQRGDVFAVFSGCSMPILLRPTQEEHVFRVFGEAYVHGVMHGEVQELLSKGETCLSDIWLE